MSVRRYVVPFTVAYVILWCQLISSISMTDVLSSETAYGPQRGPTTSDGSSTLTWHHDCSNLTGFVAQSNNSWALEDEADLHNVVNGSLASSGSYIYATAYGSSFDWYGPLYSYELPTSVAITDFTELHATIEIESTAANQLGQMVVILNDENGTPILGLSVSDGWAGADATDPQAYWMFSNRSVIRINPRWAGHVEGAYNRTLRLWQNSTGIFAELPLVDVYKVIDSGDIQTARLIRYVSVHAESYGTDPVCPTIRVHDISLDSNGTYPASYVWHHDCSNLTAFNGTGDNTWPHNSDVSVTFGSVKCSGTYFYCDDVGTGTGHHGPLYYATLATPFTLAQFIEVRAEIEIDATSADRRGWIRVGLHAPDNVTILTLQVADPGTGVSAAYANAVYRFINGTTPETPQDYPAYFGSEPYHESFAILKNSSGLYSSYPGIPNASLLESSQIESNRIVKYVSIQFNGYDTGALCETMRIHDITLEYSGSEPETLPVISLTSPGNNTVRKSGSTIDVSVTGWHTVLYRWDTDSNNSWAEPFQVPLPSGEALHVLYVYANNTLGNWTTATFAFTTDDTVPTIDAPNDIEYNECTTGHSIEWHPSDIHPASYTVYRNSLVLKSGAWNSTAESILISVDGLAAGTHNYTVVAMDAAGNTVTDTVFVTVLDGTTPTIDSPSDIQYDEGTTGHSIEWHPSDLHPASYTVYRNSLLLKSGNWNSTGEVISITVDGLALGQYNYTIVVYDLGGNWVADTVIIDAVDGTPPTIDHPEDIEYNEEDVGNFIVWNPSDVNPVSYTVFRNATPIKSGLWNSSSEAIVHSVDGLGMGSYNYTIVVYDVGGQMALDVVIVRVVDGTPPNIDHPLDLVYEAGTTGHQVAWNPSDLHPVSYEVLRNGSSVASGVWNGSSLAFSVDGLPPGVYNFTLTVVDVAGNSVIDLVLVSVVDTTIPSVNHPSDLIYEFGTAGHTIDWSPSDLYPSSYQILRNGTEMVSGFWDGSSFSVSVDGLPVGMYNYTLVLYDTNGNRASDTVFVTVAAGTTTTTTTTTATTTTNTTITTTILLPGNQTMLIIVIGAGGAVIVIIIILRVAKKGK